MLWRWMSRLTIMTLFLAACSGNSTVVPPTIGPTETPMVPTEALIIPTRTPIVPTPPVADELQDTDDVLAYLVGRQHDVALVSYTVNPDGSIADDAPVVMHQANEPMALAFTSNLLILAGYAWEVEQGLLNPNQLIKLSDIEAWYVPYSDGGAHKQALSRFVIASDERGYSQQIATLRLEQVMEMMVTFTDVAAADFVLDLLQPETLQMVLNEAGLEERAMPTPVLGTLLLYAFVVQSPDPKMSLDTVESQTTAERGVWMQSLIDDYQADPAKYHTWFTSITDWPEYAVDQHYYQNALPQGTALGYAQLLAQIATDNLISPAVSERIREYLAWPMSYPENREFLQQLGYIGGSFPGIMTEASYMLAKAAHWQDRPRVVILLQRNLSEADIDALWESDALGLIVIDLGTNPEMIQKVMAGLNQP